MKHLQRDPLPRPPARLRERLAQLSPEVLDETSARRLESHACELVRWNQAVGLVRADNWDEILERHYGESLAGLKYLPQSEGGGSLVDLGSGAGFPGWVLAAMRPGLEAYLVESRERKWAFLRTVSRKAQLSITCLNARVTPSLPDGLPDRFDTVSARAVRFSAEIWTKIAERMRPGGRVLLWVGRETPDLPEEYRLRDTETLPGSLHRRIVVWERLARKRKS